MMDKFEFPEGTFISEQFLGRGSYGEVWKVKSSSGVLTRAVKIVAKEDLPTLQKEKATLADLADADRDNMIVRAYNISSLADGRHALLMDYVGSVPLSTLVDNLKKRDLNAEPWQARDEYERVRIATQITRVLNTAYLAQIALTDIKLANFFYDKTQPNLIQVIDWNVVDDENPRQGFYQYTLPRLASILHQVFTGNSLESQPGTMDRTKLGRVQDDAEQSIWDLLTYETRTILYEMAFDYIKGNNPALELWKRWGQQERFWQRLLAAPTETPEEKQKWWFTEWKYVKGLGEEIAPTHQRLNRCEGLLLMDEGPTSKEIDILGLPTRSEWEDQKVTLTLQQVDELLEKQEFRPVEIDLLTTRRQPEAALRFELRSTQMQFYEFAYKHGLPIKPLQQFREVDKAIKQGLYNRAAQLLEEDRLPKVILLSWKNLNRLNTHLDKHLELLSARVRGHAQTLLLEELLIKYSQQQRGDWKEILDEGLEELDKIVLEIISAGQKLEEYVDPYYKKHIMWWEKDVQQKYKFVSLAVRFYHLVKADRFGEATQSLEELKRSISSIEEERIAQESVWSCLDDMLRSAPALASLKSTGSKIARTAEEIAKITDNQLLEINAVVADNKRLSDEVRDSLWEGARIATELVKNTAINSQAVIERETADEVKAIRTVAAEGKQKADDATGDGVSVVGQAANDGVVAVNRAADEGKQKVDIATGDGASVVGQAAKDGVVAVNHAADQGKQKVDDAASQGVVVVSRAADEGKQKVDDAAGQGVGTVRQAASQGVVVVSQAADEGKQKVDKATGDGASVVGQTAKDGVVAVNQAADEGKQKVDKAADDGVGVVEQAANDGVSTVNKAIDEGKQKVDEAADKSARVIERKKIAGTLIIQQETETSQDFVWGTARSGRKAIRQVTVKAKTELELEYEAATTTVLAAAQNGQVKINSAVDVGVENIDRATMEGKTAVAAAAQNGQAKINSAADVGVENIDRATREGETDVAIAAQDGQAKINSAGTVGIGVINRATATGEIAVAVAAQNGQAKVNLATEKGMIDVNKAAEEGKRTIEQKHKAGALTFQREVETSQSFVWYTAQSGRKAIRQTAIEGRNRLESETKQGQHTVQRIVNQAQRDLETELEAGILRIRQNSKRFKGKNGNILIATALSITVVLITSALFFQWINRTTATRLATLDNAVTNVAGMVVVANERIQLMESDNEAQDTQIQSLQNQVASVIDMSDGLPITSELQEQLESIEAQIATLHERDEAVDNIRDQLNLLEARLEDLLDDSALEEETEPELDEVEELPKISCSLYPNSEMRASLRILPGGEIIGNIPLARQLIEISGITSDGRWFLIQLTGQEGLSAYDQAWTSAANVNIDTCSEPIPNELIIDDPEPVEPVNSS